MSQQAHQFLCLIHFSI